VPIAYDFTPGDDLLSTLKQATQKMQDFITLRGKLAQADLTYQVVSGRLQGWVGKAYNDWAGQFDRSQKVLNDYVDQLNFHIVNVNNMLYSTELGIYHRTQRTQLPAPTPPSPPIQAPANSATLKVNTEGATPTCLYAYSDQTTGYNDQIRPFFRFTLADVADAFSPPGPPQYTVSANTGKPLGTVQQTAQAITDFLRLHILPLDARVRLIGEAFEAADNTGFTSPGFHTIHDPNTLNNMVNQIVNNASQDTKDGANAAKQIKGLTEYGDDTNITELMAEIAQHQDDPVWLSAFFGNLPPADVEKLLGRLADYSPDFRDGAVASLAQAYATWLASGGMPASAVSSLILMVLGSSDASKSGFDGYLLQDLEKDPAAGARFLQTATNDQLLQMLDGPNSAQIIDVFTVVMSNEPNTASVEDFYNRYGNLILQSRPQDAAQVFGPVQSFLSAYIRLTFPPLPKDADPASIQEWADTVGSSLSALEWGPDGKGGWHQWLQQVNAGNQQQVSGNQNVFGLALGAGSTVLLAALTDAFPALAPLTVQLILSTIMSAGASWITSQVNVGTADPEKLDDYVRHTASFMVAAELLASGKITNKDGQVVPPPTSEQEIKTILDNPTDYYVEGSAITLDTIMGSAAGHVENPDGS
jgi:hypothetical protein